MNGRGSSSHHSIEGLNDDDEASQSGRDISSSLNPSTTYHPMHSLREEGSSDDAGGETEPEEEEGSPEMNPTLDYKRPSPVRRGATATGKGWAVLRSKLNVLSLGKSFDKPPSPVSKEEALTGSQLTTELTTGTLGNVILRLGLDKDEHGQRRIPVLMNFLSESFIPFLLSRFVIDLLSNSSFSLNSSRWQRDESI